MARRSTAAASFVRSPPCVDGQADARIDAPATCSRRSSVASSSCSWPGLRLRSRTRAAVTASLTAERADRER